MVFKRYVSGNSNRRIYANFVGIFIMMIIASAFSTWVTLLFGSQRWLPGFTAPLYYNSMVVIGYMFIFFPSLLLPTSSSVIACKPDLFRAFSLNIGQVMFQSETIVSDCFFSSDF